MAVKRFRYLFVPLLVLVLTGMSSPSPALKPPPPGTLDPRFDGDGRVITDLPGSEERAAAVAIQNDHKMVVAGTANDQIVLLRYNADGSLDPRFGTGGMVSTHAGSAADVALSRQGKIVVAGSVNTDLILIRYNRDGSLDTTFGDGGAVIADVGGLDSWAVAVSVLPSGKILVAGGILVWYYDGDGPSRIDFLAARFNENGTLDTSFDGDGIATTPLGGESRTRDAALQPDGKLVVVGHVFEETDLDFFGVVRYNTDGSLDASFGDGGVIRTQLEVWSGATAVAIDRSGRIVVGGFASGSTYGIGLLRYTPGGSLDSTFGSGGVSLTYFPTNTSVTSLLIQKDGRIIAAGAADESGVSHLAVARFNTDGSLDTTFGTNGQVITVFTAVGEAAADAALANDKLVVVGWTWYDENWMNNLVLARYLLR